MGRILWRMVEKRYDGLGVFLPIHKFADRLEKMIGIADEIVMK